MHDCCYSTSDHSVISVRTPVFLSWYPLNLHDIKQEGIKEKKSEEKCDEIYKLRKIEKTEKKTM